MSTVTPIGRILEVGPGRFDSLSGELCIDAHRTRLRPRTTALLAHLVRNPDRIVSKDELMHAVWRDAIVTEDSLVQCVKEIRRAFADAGHDCIRTIPRQGYAFVAPAAPPTDGLPADADGADAGGPSEPGRVAAPLPALPASALCSAGDPVVLDLMLRGWQLFTTYTAEGHAQARTVYEAVIQREPRHAEALTLLGWIHWFDSIGGASSDSEASFRRAVELADLAVECGRHKGPPHALTGKLLLWQMRHAEALECFGRALSMTPSYAQMHFHMGDALMWCGHAEASMRHLDRALQLDADDHGVFLTIRGMAQWMLGDPSHARATLESACRRNPSYPWSHGMLAVLHHEAGDPASAQQEAQAGRRLNRRFCVRFAESVIPFLLPQHRERVAAAWRAAGLPESESEPGSRGLSAERGHACRTGGPD